MNMEHEFHMAKGEEGNSYLMNSKHQEQALFETTPVLQKAVKEVYLALLHPSMTIVDLGCSSSENTLFFVANVIKAVSYHHEKFDGHPAELKFFLNDLPSNDFNSVFQSLQRLRNSIRVEHKGETVPAFYVTGLPSSYYTRLLPRQSVHLFHSSYCLHWRSRGLVEKDKLDSFNLPFYAPSINEVKAVVEQSEQFDMNHIKMFETNWDPYDNDLEGNDVRDTVQSGMNVAKCMRAVMGPLFASHFGESVLDELFNNFARNVAVHLEKEKTKCSVIALSLRRR